MLNILNVAECENGNILFTFCKSVDGRRWYQYRGEIVWYNGSKYKIIVSLYRENKYTPMEWLTAYMKGKKRGIISYNRLD